MPKLAAKFHHLHSKHKNNSTICTTTTDSDVCVAQSILQGALVGEPPPTDWPGNKRVWDYWGIPPISPMSNISNINTCLFQG